MKTTKLFGALFLILFGLPVLSQNSILPDVDIFNLDGSLMNAKDISINNQVAVIVFWNSDNRESLDQVKLLNEEFENGLKNKDVKVICICTDYSGVMQKIRPLVSGIGLSFDVYVDKNNDLKRAMCIPLTPFAMVINQANVVYLQTGCCANFSDLVNKEIQSGIARISENR